MFLFPILLSLFVLPNVDSRVVCYYASWPRTYSGMGAHDVHNVDPFVCSHVVYSFVGVGALGEITILDPDYDLNAGGFQRFSELKNQNPDLKTMVAVGGWNEASTNFSMVALDPSTRAAFAENCVRFLQQYNLDGLDLDWEYPGQRENSRPEDKENFVHLVRELRSAFEPHRYLLTAAVAATQSHIDISYDVPALDQLLDFISVMTYDLHGPWDGVTGAHAPLHPQPSDPAHTVLTVDASIQAWIASGATPSKLNVGLANYGRVYTLADSTQNGTGAAITEFDSNYRAPYSGDDATWTYLELCSHQLNHSELWRIVNYEDSFVYAVCGTLWAGYDDTRTIAAKAVYARENGLGGVMFWALHGDDFQGYCGDPNSLIKTAAAAFGQDNEDDGEDNEDDGEEDNEDVESSAGTMVAGYMAVITSMCAVLTRT